MRFMIIRKADEESEAGVLPSTELLGAMGAYMEEMGKAGILLGGDGLKATSHGARVKFTKGVPVITDGPFTEAKELIAGYAIIDVASKAEALEWLKRWPTVDADGEAELELREFFEASDFGEQFTPEQREAEERLRAQVAAKGQ